MRNTLITQVALISISLIIIFVFVKPSFMEIKAAQDEIFSYSDVIDKAVEYNQKLQTLIATRDSFSANDIQSLDTFIPSEIDALNIMHDIEAIFALKNIPIFSLTAGEIVLPQGEVALETDIVLPESTNSETAYQDFEVIFVGTYFDVKDVLKMIEANKTLLEVMEVSFEVVEPTLDEKSVPNEIPKDSFKFIITLRAFSVQGFPL